MLENDATFSYSFAPVLFLIRWKSANLYQTNKKFHVSTLCFLILYPIVHKVYMQTQPSLTLLLGCYYNFLINLYTKITYKSNTYELCRLSYRKLTGSRRPEPATLARFHGCRNVLYWSFIIAPGLITLVLWRSRDVIVIFFLRADDVKIVDTVEIGNALDVHFLVLATASGARTQIPAPQVHIALSENIKDFSKALNLTVDQVSTPGV